MALLLLVVMALLLLVDMALLLLVVMALAPSTVALDLAAALLLLDPALAGTGRRRGRPTGPIDAQRAREPFTESLEGELAVP